MFVLVEITRINHVQFDSIRRFIEFWVLTKLTWKCLKVIGSGGILWIMYGCTLGCTKKEGPDPRYPLLKNFLSWSSIWILNNFVFFSKIILKNWNKYFTRMWPNLPQILGFQWLNEGPKYIATKFWNQNNFYFKF